MTFGLPRSIPAGSTPPAAPTGGAPGKHGGAAGWAKSNPTLALGGAGIVVVVIVAMASKKGGAGAAPGGLIDPATGLPVTTTAAPNQTGTFDSTANDIYNSLMGQINSLSAQIGALTPGPSTPTPPPKIAVNVKAPVPKPVAKPVPKPVAKPVPKPKQAGTYTVVKGDTLTSIAGKLGLPNWQTLYTTNRTAIGSNPNLIRVGQVLKR